jgi:hypothetical protein
MSVSKGTQYWIYAFLNKKFGTEVKINRSFLAKRYEVNKHDFSVETNTLNLKIVLKYIKDTLLSSGYKKENTLGSDSYLINRDGFDTYVVIRENPDVLNLSIFSYEERKVK